jgi:hypothetical protein
MNFLKKLLGNQEAKVHRPLKRTMAPKRRISIRKRVQTTFDDLWNQNVRLIEVTPQFGPLMWPSEEALRHAETMEKRGSFFETVLGLVEAHVSSPEEVETAVKLAFQIAPREKWSCDWTYSGIIHSGGADAALDVWGEIEFRETLSGPSAQGLLAKTDEFKQHISG